MSKQRAFIPFDTNKTSSDFGYLNEKLCEWQEYAYSLAASSEPLSMTVPVGEQSDLFLVTGATVAFILASSLSIAYSIVSI